MNAVLTIKKTGSARMESIHTRYIGGGTRRTFVVGLILTMLFALERTADARSSAPPPPHILFICKPGTVKSAVAREIFRRRAAERGVSVIAFSRGITPEEHVSPALRQQLIADGIDSTRDGLQKLEQKDLEAADIVVVFDPLPRTLVAPRALDWSALPSMNDTYPLARTDLDRRIDALLDAIAQGRAR